MSQWQSLISFTFKFGAWKFYHTIFKIKLIHSLVSQKICLFKSKRVECQNKVKRYICISIIAISIRFILKN